MGKFRFTLESAHSFSLRTHFPIIHFVTPVSVHIFLLKRSLGSAQSAECGGLAGANADRLAKSGLLIPETFGGLVVYGESPAAAGSAVPL
jgi:hypothetical protein